MRADGVDPLILDAGDIFFSTSKLDDKNRKSQIHRAKSIISGYGKIGCNVINVGHYEVLNGLNFLNSIILFINFTYFFAVLMIAFSCFHRLLHLREVHVRQFRA